MASSRYCQNDGNLACPLITIFITQESRIAIINIEEFSAETVGDMVEFFYTGNYGDLYLPKGLLLLCIALCLNAHHL